jgi:uncharacterized protein (TIGR02588 family)
MDEEGRSRTSARRIEISLAVLSGAMVLAMVGYLLYAAFLMPSSSVLLSVTADAPDPNGAIRFIVHNDGGRTASNVQISLVLEDEGMPAGRRTVQLDYVPAHSEIGGALLLAPTERGLERKIVVEGYMDP